MSTPKVFGIGLHKTGTSTLRECFRILGYNVCPEEIAYLTRVEAANKNYQPCLRVATFYGAFEDSPWNYCDVYKILDIVFPGSLFILSERDEERWFVSFLRWVALHSSSSDINIISTLGVAVLLEKKAAVLAAYRQHNQEVVDYFSGHGPGRLLRVDWEKGDGWDKLCGFLGRPSPSTQFPHVLRYDPSRTTYV